MKISDLLRMSTGSLLKRKLRTSLTVLGVMIGIAAIVTMMALGEGMNRTMLEQIEQYGSLRTVMVREGGGGGGGGGGYMSQTSGDNLENKLTDDTVELLKTLEHVELVSPVLEFQAIISTGKYRSNIWGQAMTLEALRDKGWNLAEGSLPDEKSELKFLYGNMVTLDFMDSRGTMVYYEKGEIPDVDLMNDMVFTIFDMDAYYGSGTEGGIVGDEDGSRAAPAPPKKYIIPTAGVLEGGFEDYREYSWSTYCDIDALMAYYKRVFRNKPIPGQPVKSNGSPYRQIYYSSIYVKTDDMNNVLDVQKAISELGYQADSDAEWIQQMSEENRARAAMLGGVGAVALLVAAIGIANTMMMSIYERTREIGVMKVLGCDLKDIRSLFLIEAAIIGFVGGVIGIGLSYIVCLIINLVTKASTAVVPLWLVPASLIFAVFVGMAAGFVPSGRAMRLSPLAAIRND